MLCEVKEFVTLYVMNRGLGPSRTRGQNCLFMSKICHHNEKPSETRTFGTGCSFIS